MLTSPQVRQATVTALLLLAAPFVAGAAQAADPPPGRAADGFGPVVRLEVEAPPDCTTREELAARIAARSRRIAFAPDAAIAVRVTVAPGPGGRAVTGALTIARPGTPGAVRRITAASCEQASDGLALVIALALDPDAPATGVPAPDVAAPPPPPAATVAAPAPPARSPPATPVHTGWVAEAGAEAVFGPAPRPLAGVRAGARLTRDRGRSIWSPALVLSVVHAWTGDLDEPGGTAAFTLDAANLDACPLRLAAGAWEGRACGSLLVGRIEAAGSNTYAPASAARPFAAGGGSLLLAADLGRRLGAPVILGAQLEAAASWIRDSHAFSPTVFHRAAAVTLAAGLWVGLRFR